MIKKDYGTYRIGLFEIDVEIDYNSTESRELIDFLFRDLPAQGAPLSPRRFEVLIVGDPSRMSLWAGEKQLYFGQSKHALAHMLVNEIIYDCIINNYKDHAVHAAAFCIGNRGIIMPGKSGSGKSSLAAWLTVFFGTQGCSYLTDELVLLSKTGRIRSFTRPISLKSPSCEALGKHIPRNNDENLAGQPGVMVPHRSLTGHWTAITPMLDTLIFPEFIKDHPASLTRLSGARSCLRLMECFVNARNIQDHGFKELAELTRSTKSFELKYGSFADLPAILQPVLFAIAS